MAFDAVILAGGRGSRLGGISKASLVVNGRPLVREAVTAAAGARARVVVGDAAAGLPADVIVTREDPPFGGPAAALGAGVVALDGIRGDAPLPELVLVLACDMPRVGAVVELLVSALDLGVDGDGAVDGVVAVDGEGRPQYLAAVYRRASLSRALARGSLAGASMRSLLAELRLGEVLAPTGTTDDVDTWEDARRLHVSAATASPSPAPPTAQPRALPRALPNEELTR